MVRFREIHCVLPPLIIGLPFTFPGVDDEIPLVGPLVAGIQDKTFSSSFLFSILAGIVFPISGEKLRLVPNHRVPMLVLIEVAVNGVGTTTGSISDNSSGRPSIEAG